jgi:molecular chaperone DnaK
MATLWTHDPKLGTLCCFVLRSQLHQFPTNKPDEWIVSSQVGKTIGIDLGTTFSVVAHLDRGGKPQTVMNMEGDLSTPSVVYFGDGEVVVGKEAVKAAVYEPESVVQFVKREMGKQWCEKAIRGAHLPPEVVQAAILQKLRRDAETKVGGISEVVVTVPAFFNEPRRKATMDAGRLAGLQVRDIINEPTAAAIAYGVHAGFVSSGGQARQAESILVYDLGGGTFDVTLMEIDGSRYTAIATDGDVQLGGIDWDRRIVDFVADSFLEQHGIDPRQDPVALQTLLQEAEDAKRALSTRTSIAIRFAHQDRRAHVTITREEFDSLTSDLLQRTLFTVERLLRSAKRSWSGLTRILLVGGSTRMPMVRQALEQTSGMKVDRSMSPDEAVAHGAALYAGFLQQGSQATDCTLAVKNVNSHDLGVLGVEKATGMKRRRIMIPRNTTLPARSKSKFVTHRNNQQRVVVHVIEGGDDSGTNATAIGKCVVSKLPPDLPAKSPVIVQFFYGANGRLSVKASLPDAGSESSVTIERSTGMGEDELLQWEQRIAQGQFLIAPAAPPPATARDDAKPRPADAAAESALTDSTDFEPPHVFDDDEDSEVFSDLEF